MRDQPNCDQSREWRPLKGRPYDYHDELQLMSISGNTTEFQNRLGYRMCRKNRHQAMVFAAHESADEKSHSGSNENLLQEAPERIWYVC